MARVDGLGLSTQTDDGMLEGVQRYMYRAFHELESDKCIVVSYTLLLHSDELTSEVYLQMTRH